jgi:hypothetical protein
MKKSFFVLCIMVTFVFTSCCLFIQTEKPVAVKKEVTKTATIDYVTSLPELPGVQNLKPGGMLIIFVDTGWVATPKIVGYAGRFQGKTRFGYLDNWLNWTSLSSIWKGKKESKSQLVIGSKGDLQSYEIDDNLVIQDTGRFWVEVSDTLYFKDKYGKFLRTY